MAHPKVTSVKDINAVLDLLSSHAREWVSLEVEERISLVEQVINDFARVTDRWSDLTVRAKGISQRTRGNDRDWLEIATINRIHSSILSSLRDIKNGRKPTVKGGYRLMPNGQVAARVYPDSIMHGLAFRGIIMDVWLEPGVNLYEAKKRQAEQYFDGDISPRVALVLGAGNASSLLSSDTMHKLFTDLSVVILKMNPVNSYLGPLIEEAYQSLIKRNFLKIVYGGAETGDFLVNHHLVDEIHMTGSDRTFDAIVFGRDADSIQRKKAGGPLITKPLRGELGCITPWIIVPGRWTKKDIKEQASKLAFWMMRHEGYICFAPRIIVLPKSWESGESFQDSLIDALSGVEPIRAYYPGSAEKQKKFVDAHPEAIEIGTGMKDHVPWTVIPDLVPGKKDDICYRRESFSGLCGIVSLDAPTTPEFLDKAVDFLNTTVWGTLSASIVVDKKSLEDPAINKAVEQSISDLKYGTVALNGPGTWGFYTMKAPWGGYPGSSIEDIQSGNCKVANFLFLHRPQKTVVKAPFKMRPYAFHGITRNLHRFSKKLADFETHTTIGKLSGLLLSAIRNGMFKFS